MRTRKFFKLLVCLAVVGTCLRVARAETPSNSDAELQAIRAAARGYVQSLQQGDEAKLRQMWTPEGDYVDSTGNTYKARDVFIDGYFGALAAAGNGSTVASESSIKLLSPNVAIEDGTSGMGVLANGSVVQGRYSAVWVKRDGRWLLDSLRESTSAAPPSKDHLQQLEWLLGEWVATAPDAQIISSARWSDRGTYLLREFLILANDGQAVDGSERIAWDPDTGEIQSWTFDSKGGRGEGRWRRDGDRWVVEATEVLADGTQASTTATYQRQDADRYLWQVTSASVGDMKLSKRQVEYRRAKD
jgi:uncharacterized protein (TIGR02246 family)